MKHYSESRGTEIPVHECIRLGQAEAYQPGVSCAVQRFRQFPRLPPRGPTLPYSFLSLPASSFDAWDVWVNSSRWGCCSQFTLLRDLVSSSDPASC